MDGKGFRGAYTLDVTDGLSSRKIMKLYKIFKKEAFVTRLPLEEVRIELPAAGMIPAKIAIMPGVPKEHCEIIAAHMAQRRVEVPAHDEEIVTVVPEKTYIEHELVPGHFETQSDYIQGHYETREIWIPEHEEDVLVEVPGYYEWIPVTEPGKWVTKTQWVEGHWETYTAVRPADPATGRKEMTYEDKRWVEGYEYSRKVWEEGRTRLIKFWVDPTWEMQAVTVPGQYRDHRVWIEGHIGDVEVWIPDQYKPVTKVIPEHTVTTIVAIPVTVERQNYWQEAYEKCWMVTPDQNVVDEAGMLLYPLDDLQNWFDWYVGTQGGLVFVEMAKHYGWFDNWSMVQVMQKAWEKQSPVLKDMSVRAEAELIMQANVERFRKFMENPKWIQQLKEAGRWEEVRRIQERIRQTPRQPLTDGEIALLIKAGVIAAMVAAAALLVYHTWPGARFELTISYPEPVYVGRYMEVVTELDLVGVSPQGTPTYLRCTETGGPIMGETRTRDRDEWLFGEEWLWSSWIEDARWMGIGETRYWFSAEVEYLGMLSRSGATFYMLHAGRMDVARGGNEPGWTKSSTLWGTWEELEHHIRI